MRVPAKQLHRQFKIDACTDTGWEFVWVYSVQGNYRPWPNPAEIESGVFLSRADLEVLPAEHCAPAFLRILCEFRARRLFPGVARGVLLR